MEVQVNAGIKDPLALEMYDTVMNCMSLDHAPDVHEQRSRAAAIEHEHKRQ